MESEELGSDNLTRILRTTGGESEMKLRTENLQLAAYVIAKGAQLDQVDALDTDEGVTVVFVIDCWGVGDVKALRDEFYRGLGGINTANYYQQLGVLSEQMFTAIYHREGERRRREDAAAANAGDDASGQDLVNDEHQAVLPLEPLAV